MNRPNRSPAITRLLGGVVAACAIAACGRRPAAAAGTPIRVAAAADLDAAFEDIGKRYEEETGQTVAFSFGSSGLLAKQIAQGAPFDVFAAADVAFADAVVAAGACDPSTKAPYARGRIAVWTRGPGGRAAPRSLAELADPRFARIAIANPEHAPYGAAAKNALSTAGIWEQVRPRIVYGENVRHALRLAETGNAEAAIVALALVMRKTEGSWIPVDDRLHAPIDQTIVACRRGGRFDGGRSFAAFVRSPSGRAILRSHGFLSPGESPEATP